MGFHEPPQKRIRTGIELIPEEEFAKMHADPIPINVLVPVDENNTQWELRGQTLPLESNVMSTVKELKVSICEHLGGIPPNKFQLKAPVVGFLKDSLTLAHYNIEGGATLTIQLRQRGGRR